MEISLYLSKYYKLLCVCGRILPHGKELINRIGESVTRYKSLCYALFKAPEVCPYAYNEGESHKIENLN